MAYSVGLERPFRQFKSSQFATPIHAKDKALAQSKRVVEPKNISLAAGPSGRCAGWAVRRFDSLVVSEVPDVVLCLCAQGEGAFLRIAPQRYKAKEPPAKGHRGPSTVSKINGEQKGSHVK
jgi:hypothetical protein